MHIHTYIDQAQNMARKVESRDQPKTQHKQELFRRLRLITHKKKKKKKNRRSCRDAPKHIHHTHRRGKVRVKLTHGI